MTVKPYLIAEIGNNHQGSVDTALRMVETFAASGASAVKFQRRNNKLLYTDRFYNSPYDNPNSYAETYGEHRDYLELDLEDLVRLRNACENLNVDFIITPFDLVSLQEVVKLKPSSIKISSADLVFKQLIIDSGYTRVPMILSTGHATYDDIDRAIDWIPHKDVSLLHCTAAYPAHASDLNLNCITEMISRYGLHYNIGLSDHEVGILASVIAYNLGAVIFEKHVTLDRSAKGTDHCFSLEPAGFAKLRRNLSNISIMMGSPNKGPQESESAPIAKMAKSLVIRESIPAGHIISINDIDYRSPADQAAFRPYEEHLVVGKKALVNLDKHSYITKSDISL